MEKLDDIIFYNIDKAIRIYRNYAQKKLREHNFKITIDQWLTIKAILENPGVSQKALGEKIFKDNASVTRIIEHLVKSKYLTRDVYEEDRRKTVLKVTDEGMYIIEQVQQLVVENRKVALNDIPSDDLAMLVKSLQKIIDNCQ